MAELQEVLDMGQSRISSHLGLLRQGELVHDRREGKKTFYALNRRFDPQGLALMEAACASVDGSEQIVSDHANLKRILEKRKQLSEQYFNSVGKRLCKNYCPGRRQAIGHFLLHLTPKIRIADLGAGEGLISQLLARRAERVTCVDNSPKMVEFGRELAKKNGFSNLDYQLGDIEGCPLRTRVLTSLCLQDPAQALHHAQHPETAVQEAFRILQPGRS